MFLLECFLERPPREDYFMEFKEICNKVNGVIKRLKRYNLEMDNRKSWMSEFKQNGFDKFILLKVKIYSVMKGKY